MKYQGFNLSDCKDIGMKNSVPLPSFKEILNLIENIVIYQTKSFIGFFSVTVGNKGQKQQLSFFFLFLLCNGTIITPKELQGGKISPPQTPEPAPVLTASFQWINNESKGV